MGEQDTGEQPASPAVRPRTQVLSVLGLVAVGALAAYLLIGDGQPASSRPGGDAATSSSASSRPEEVEVLTVETITQSQPTGRWRAQVIGRSQLLRSGVRVPLDYRQQPTRWTFTSDSCSARRVHGHRVEQQRAGLPLHLGRARARRRPPAHRRVRQARVRRRLGRLRADLRRPATHTYRYSFGSFAGSANRLTSRLVIEISTEFSGSCQATPDDALTYVEDQVLTKLPES